MIVMSVTEFARNMKEVLNRIEYKGEEVHLVRNRKRVIKLIPEAIGASAVEVFGDLQGSLPEFAAADWLRDSRMSGFREEPRMSSCLL
ncbi:MAG: type II toxin-antitoxin system Phd/YefM family antitoxin [Spirochaetota bacterium]